MGLKKRLGDRPAFVEPITPPDWTSLLRAWRETEG
jgi:hypothetical protein